MLPVAERSELAPAPFGFLPYTVESLGQAQSQRSERAGFTCIFKKVEQSAVVTIAYQIPGAVTALMRNIQWLIPLGG